VFSAAAYGATVACPTTTATQTLSGASYKTPPVAGVTTAGTGSATASADNALANVTNYGTGTFAAGGCLQTDLSFNNFRVITSGADTTTSNSATVATDTTLTAAGIYGTFSNPASTQIDSVFAATRGAVGNTTDGAVNESISNFFDNGKPGSNATATYDVLFTVDRGSRIWDASILLRYFNFTRDPNNTLTATFCQNYTASAAITTAFTTCAAAGGTLASTTISLVNLQNNTDTLINIGSLGFASTTTNLYVDLHFAIDGTSTTSGGTNNGFTNSYLYGIGLQFDETPEPATSSLLGLGLAGLAFLARRRGA
jgi:hypothetical protein